MDNEDNQTTGSTTRKVIASAIDENGLILEEPETGNKISWPLDKIPRPLDLGNELNLILQCATTTTTGAFSTTDNTLARQTASPESSSKEDLMRKMLENLVN